MKWTLTLSSEDGTTLELTGNHSGTNAGLVVPGGGFPLKGGTHPNQPHPDSGTANPFGMTDAETLDCLGPSWAAMSTTERQGYGARRVTPRRNAA